jgi:Na+/H+-dicarboxylate symporter
MPELESKNTGGRTALGVLGVVFGGYYLIAALSALLQVAELQRLVERSGAPQLLTRFGQVSVYLDAGVNIVLAVLLIVVGVGLLKQRQWGVEIGTKWAIARIVWSVVAAAMALLGPFAAQPDPETLAHGYKQYMQHHFTGTALTEIFAGLVLSSILAVIFLCLLSRPMYKNQVS